MKCVCSSQRKGASLVFSLPPTVPKASRTRGLEGRGGLLPPGKGKDRSWRVASSRKGGVGADSRPAPTGRWGSGPLTCEDLLQQKNQKIAICPHLQ